jgi:hypothetical protein
MTEFNLSPRLLDLILLLTAAEFVFLGLRNARSGRGLQWADLALALGPGFLLMLAFRLSQPSALSAPVLISLSAAGVLHALDFFRRDQGKSR